MSSSRKRKIDFNTVYHSNNSGDFKIIEYIGGPTELVRIKFLLTGTEKIVTESTVACGRVKDNFYPRVCGVGYIGEFEGNISQGWTYVIYRTWYKMLSRCYVPSEKGYKYYGAVGVSVDPSWFNFNTFFNDVQLLPNYDKKVQFPDKFQLDKDYIQQNIPKEKRIYSKNTCIWMYIYDNMALKILANKTNKYVGVDYLDNNTYRARNLYNRNIGTYTDEIAAANAYNFYYNFNFGNDQLRTIKPLNDVPYMSAYEFTKYSTNNTVEAIKIIK